MPVGINWFLLALINPASHAIANHLDKYIISRSVRGLSVGARILFAALFGVLALPIIWIIHPAVFGGISLTNALALMVNGSILVVAVMFYLYALRDEEASLVAPFFQLIPVFGFILGFLILGESLGPGQALAAGLIVLGGAILSVDFSGRGAKLKTRLLLLMLGCCLFYGLNGVIFKLIALKQGFLNSLFWDLAGKFAFGLILFACVASYRQSLIAAVKTNRLPVISLAFISETLGLLGEIALIFAVLFAPVALVQSVGGLQPLFVLILGIFITLFFPKFGREAIGKKDIMQKTSGIAVITAGVYFLGV